MSCLNVKAILVQASRCKGNAPLYTVDVEFPRTMLAELLTHRVLSKCTSSTRAVPITSAIKQTDKNMYIPQWTGKQKGMIGHNDLTEEQIDQANILLENLYTYASRTVKALDDIDIHKQDAGRYLEPFQYIPMRISATEWLNFIWLRDHYAAYPPIQKLASILVQVLQDCVAKGTAMELFEGELHVPSVVRVRNSQGILKYYHPVTGIELTPEEAIDLSMSVSAQKSYRTSDTSGDKVQSIKSKLFGGDRVHASPSEHVAIAYPDAHVTNPYASFKDVLFKIPRGFTHIDLKGNYWSGNFRHWIQYRQLIPNHDAQLTAELNNLFALQGVKNETA